MRYAVQGGCLLRAKGLLPGSGAWTADVETGRDVALSGRVSLELGGLTLSGTVVRSGVVGGAQHVRLVGGAGGLSRRVEPKQYVRTPWAVVVRELLEAAGEQPSEAVDALDGIAERWVLAQVTVGEALGAIARRLECGWRVEPSGAVWMGVDPFAEAGLEGATLMAEFPQEGRQVWGVDRHTLVPGVAVQGRRVVQVQHHASADRRRTEVWWRR